MEDESVALAWLKRVLLLMAILVPLGMVGWYGIVALLRPSVAPYGTPTASLRMSGPQFILNWQSFPGREVLVERCTVTVSADGQVTCRVIEGADEMGQIVIDPETFDAASAEWAKRTCVGTRPPQACTTRVSGVIKRRSDGRPVLEEVKAER